MGLWYRRTENTVYETVHLVDEFLHIWFSTRRETKFIRANELAGVIDMLYEVDPAPGQWVIVEVRPQELKKYISVYRKERPQGGKATETKNMMQDHDWTLTRRYKQLLDKGFEPTPIFLSGAESDDGEKGIMLVDGRHRIYSAAEQGHTMMLAYIPLRDLPMFKEARF